MKEKFCPFKRKRANGFTLLEILATIALFLLVTVFLLQAFNLGYLSIGGLEGTNLALFLAGDKLEELRNTPYDSIVNTNRTPIPGHPGYESQVEVGFPQAPNQDIKKVMVVIYYPAKDGTKQLVLKTLIAKT